MRGSDPWGCEGGASANPRVGGWAPRSPPQAAAVVATLALGWESLTVAVHVPAGGEPAFVEAVRVPLEPLHAGVDERVLERC